MDGEQLRPAELNLEIEYLPVDALKPYEKNARRHKKTDVDAVAASIEELGFDDPIGIWGSENVIVEGHGRLLAAKKLGMERVPCIRLDHLSDEGRRAYALAHNRTAELSVWDNVNMDEELRNIHSFDMSRFGFDRKEAEVRDDNYEPSIPTVPKAKRGDIWTLGRHRLMCGDSTSGDDVAALMDGRLADMLLTDPPYNVDVEMKAGKIQNDNMPEEDFRVFLAKAFTCATNVMRGGWSIPYLARIQHGIQLFRCLPGCGTHRSAGADLVQEIPDTRAAGFPMAA